ncbi:universal stress protein [Allokutzneria oryzae]|uniref:Universal stress protein n=1 Tax=Allokutzneria oryzae TaxID=1378989 RepID=A0ABV6A5T7_9PSEU
MIRKGVRRPVVAGVSPFLDRRPVVGWAASEAVRRGLPLRLVHVCQDLRWFGLSRVDRLSGREECYGLRAQGEAVLREVAAAVRLTHPDLEVSATLATGEPAAVLAAESRGAELVVVGTHDQGRFADLVLGSVAREVILRSAAPVVTVPQLDRPARVGEGPVVVGVDGTEVSQAALEFGLEEASRTGVQLYAVHCWLTPPDRADRPLIRDEERRVLAEALAGVGEHHPDVRVVPVLSGADPAEELLCRSRVASLVAVGSRGRRPLAAAVLGSVSRDVVRHSCCPIAVVCPGPPTPRIPKARTAEGVR